LYIDPARQQYYFEKKRFGLMKKPQKKIEEHKKTTSL